MQRFAFHDDLFDRRDEISASAAEKLADHAHSIYVRTDRMFAVLMALQWLGGIATALIVSPRTWIGDQGSLHPHVLMAVFGGAVLASLPIYLAIRRPGKLGTRMVIATSQVLFSALLIHLTGGRIETHFHVFGSLAFLAAYRDWRVLIPATVIVAVDHLVRGIWWPESVFGIATASHWRWLEHAAWVVFEDLFLVIIIRQSVREMKELALHTSQLEVVIDAAKQREAALQLATAQAEQANRAKSQFLANISHEIRTPLNGILGFTEILVRQGDRIESSEREEHLETIRSSGRHLLALINDVLDLAKIEAGQMQVESVACSPHQIIAETVSVLRVRAIEKGIALEYRWNGRVPESIRIDPYRFKQLLINLIGNAIKFTEQGCVLVVAEVVEADAFREAGEPGDSTDLLVEIRDTGIGIAAEKLETVFEPFVQADESVTRKYGGTGLGLAISRRIAASLGGCLSAASVLGRGSSFAIRVPTGSLDGVRMLEQPPQTGRTVARQESRGELRLDGVRVLVVDDGETNRRLVRLLLQRVGATVESAENGKVAIELARRTPFDVILLDMQMPVMDGYSAARALREQGYAGAVIALTAHAMKGDREKCEQAGCTGFLSKPIDADVLMHTVAGCAAARRSPPDGEPHAPHDGAKGVEPIYSLLPTDDEELRDVVLEFIDTLSNKMVEMETAWDAGDFESLEQLAHWLKGAGGTVGFRCFTSSAAELERSASSGDRTGTASSLSVLRGLQQRVTV